MNDLKKEFIFEDVNKLKGVGIQLSKYLKRKKIEKIKDILLNLPYSTTDRSKISNIKDLEVGKIQTIRVFVKKAFKMFFSLDNMVNAYFIEYALPCSFPISIFGSITNSSIR